MSLMQIEAEITKLTPEELAHLKASIDALCTPAKVAPATPEMLALRKEISAKFISGEWSADLPDWQETRELDKKKDPWNS